MQQQKRLGMVRPESCGSENVAGGSGMHSEQVAIVLDVLRNRLDPACRARALTALRAMTLDVYLELAGDLSVTNPLGTRRSR